MHKQTDLNTNDAEANHFYVVGIGASAGGVQALKSFFDKLPSGSGMAYVVVMHPSSDDDGQLARLLQAVTSLNVTEVAGSVPLQPNRVYIVPPRQHLVMEDNALTVSDAAAVEESRAPVDMFFRILAESKRGLAVAVVLSGMGANGSMGLKRVKENGGAVFVQHPREAMFNEMPRNAIATDMVDEVLPVADIPNRILAYTRNQGAIRIPPEAIEQPQQQQQALREILIQLRLRTGHDFSNYKRPTLLRRIERRINIHNLPSLPSYTGYLQQHPEEIKSLLKDLLISVTNFFRDKRTFEELEKEVLPQIFQHKHSGDQVRIWVAGCATGEEAYSLAMLCAERTMHVLDSPKVQIFATDIDEAAIAIAREGIYTLNDAADVSSERLRRFFTKEGDGYRVRREIREMVLFASHNFLKDPPFSHLHLITCRNVLIYLNHTAQEWVMETFHFALNPGGYLFLGTSESADSAVDLYNTISREHHIFQSRQATHRSYPVPDSVSSFRKYELQPVAPASPETASRSLDRITYGELHQKLLEQYAPPSIVINEEYDIVHLSERAGRYLQISGGEISRNLLKLIRQEVRLELRSALYQAVQRQMPIAIRGVKVSLDEGTEMLNIEVRPALRENSTTQGFLLILFTPEKPGTIEEVVYTSEEPLARHLEEELMRLKAQLRTSNEQHEFQAEELKAANEELQAMNEELRSAAEELETSKEELQSINEELTTVNQELKVKVEEVSMAGNNLQNLINSTDLETIFLDRSFRVVLFTPSARNLFNLISSDYGRPLSDITSKLLYDKIIEDAELVLQRLQAVEREVRSIDEHTYLMRLLPYRTIDDRIKGVVITFIDITERIQAEEELRQAEEKYLFQLEEEVIARTTELKESQQQYKSLVVNTPDLITRWDKNLKLIFANRALEGILGKSRSNRPEKLHREADPPDHALLDYTESLQQVFTTGMAIAHYHTTSLPAGEVFYYSRLVPEKNEAGDVVTVLAIAGDISAIRRAEEKLKASNKLLQSIYDTTLYGMSVLKAIRDPEGAITDFRILIVNKELERETGRTDLIGKLYTVEYPGVRAVGVYDLMLQTMETGVPGSMEYHYTYEQFNKWFSCQFVKLDDGLVATNLDITERKKAEAESRAKQHLLQATMDSSVEMIQVFEAVRDTEGEIIDFRWILNNHTSEKQYGDVIGKSLLQSNPGVVEAGIFETFKQVVETGKVSQKERHYVHEQFDGWFYQSVVKLGDGIASTTTDITKRKQAEQEVLHLKDEIAQRATDKYLTLFNSIGQGFCIVELLFNEAGEAYDYRFLETNPAFERLTGLHNVVGKTMKSLVPGHEAYWFQHFDEIARTGIAKSFEGFAACLQNGVWYDVYAFRTGTPAENQVVILFHDITERKAAAATLQQTAALDAFRLRLSDALRPLSDAGQIQLAAATLLGEHLYASQVHYGETSGDYIIIQQGYGNGLPPMTGRFRHRDFGEQLVAGYRSGKVQVCYDTATDPSVSEVEKKVLQSAHIGAYIVVPLVKNGIWVASLAVQSVEPRKWKRTEIKLVEEIAERTWAAVERARTEEALRITEERYRIVLQSAKLGAWDWNIPEDTVVWNKEHYEIMGADPDHQRMNMAFLLQFIHPDDADRVRHVLYEAVAEKGIYQAVFRIVRGDNQETRWMTDFGQVIEEKEGKAVRMVGVMSDITEARMLEQQREEFIGIASHELKTPVTSIKVYTQVLQDIFEASADAESAELMHKLDLQVDRLTRLIQDLLDTTKIVEGQLVLHKEYFELESLITENLEGWQRLSNRHRIVWQADGRCSVYADRERIGQVLTNFISNAIKYAPEGGDITIMCRLHHQQVEVSVQDQGIGISEEMQRQVFDRFFRVQNNPLHTFPGLGLGLYISAGIINRHGGTIRVNSTVGEGSVFCFSLPFKAGS